MLPICIGILAYQGIQTLNHTLSSFHRANLFDYVAEHHIVFQDVGTPRRRAWAEGVVTRFPVLQPVYNPTNTGHAAFGTIVELCKSEMVIVLEEDFFISIAPAAVKAQLENAVWLLRRDVDAVRLRSRTAPGHPNWSHETWKSTGAIGSTHLLDHVYWDSRAEDHVDEIRVCRQWPKTWCAVSRHGQFTMNPTMYRRPFAAQLYKRVPRSKLGARSFEPWLTRYWAHNEFTVAISDAIFTHLRLDREQLPRDVLMAYAVGYGFNTIYGLCHAFSAATGEKQTLVLFVLLDDRELQRLRRKFQRTLLIPTGRPAGNPAHARWPVIHEWLNRHATSYDRVILTDARDIAIYSDPFVQLDRSDALQVFTEVKSYHEDRSYNQPWIRRCYGQLFLNTILHEPITCCGIVAGPTKKVESYLKAFVQQLKTKAACDPVGTDTAIHVWIIHSELPGVEIVNSSNALIRHSPAWTQEGIASIEQKMRPHGYAAPLKNAIGQPYTLVHQLDRAPHLWAAYNSQHAPTGG